MLRTNIYLDAAQCEALDRLAAAEGSTRSAVIRRLIDRAVSGNHDDLPSDLDAIESSFGVLADLVVEERGPDARADHLHNVWRADG
jgi:hypothetical protein